MSPQWMPATGHTTYGRTKRRGHTTPTAPRDPRTVAAALALTRELLDGQSIPGVTPRVTKLWREADRPWSGGPGLEMALWFQAHPQHLQRWVALWQSLALRDPADWHDAARAEQAADGAEDVAQIDALATDTPQSLETYARLALVASARSQEAARAARDRASALREGVKQ
jgi:hypothetical protein